MKKQKTLKIGRYTVGQGHPVFIIAEAGVNHNGSVALAKKLVDAAKAAGADAVKFQNFKAEDVTTATAGMAAYQKRNTGKSESQIDMIRKFELSEADFKVIAAHAKKRGIIFISAPHSGFKSVDVLKRLSVPAYKFGSADLDNLPVLQYAARLKKPIIISTGMADMADIKEAVTTIRKAGNDKIVVFQCTTDYPAKLSDVNVRAMNTIRDTFNVIAGYSDHTIGLESSLVAVALGASVLEKHLTLDNSMQGPDHKASANPKDFKKYVEAMRNVEVILGSSKKTVAKSARPYMPLVLKSVVAAKAVRKGEKFTKENLAIKRPRGDLAPKFYWDMLGKRATRDLSPDEFIKKNDYEK
jgi:N,N'-diacetyllegionaminate synthase